MGTAYHCDDCDIDFRHVEPLATARREPFTVDGHPGVHVDRARGRVLNGQFVTDATCCPHCGRLALDNDLRELMATLGWQAPAPSPNWLAAAHG